MLETRARVSKTFFDKSDSTQSAERTPSLSSRSAPNMLTSMTKSHKCKQIIRRRDMQAMNAALSEV